MAAEQEEVVDPVMGGALRASDNETSFLRKFSLEDAEGWYLLNLPDELA